MQNISCSSRHPAQALSKPLTAMALALATTLGLTLSFSAQAATITVTSASDAAAPAGGCSLRGAVMAVNSGSNTNGCAATGAYGSDDTILFASALTGSTITLTGEIEIQKSLTINGGSANAVTLDGNNLTRIFNITGGYAFTFKYLTLQNGKAGLNGGAIYADYINQGSLSDYTLKVQNSTFKNNQAPIMGGAICISDLNNILTVENSTFSDNSAGSGGGAIFVGGQNAEKAAQITNSTFVGNRTTEMFTMGRAGGGAIFADFLDASYLTLVNNQAARKQGHSIFIEGHGNIRNSLIVGGPDTVGRECLPGQSYPAWYVRFSGSNNIEWRNGNNESSCGSTSPVLIPAGMTLEQIVSPTLADNGGPTQTLALPAGSPAIDAGSPFIAGTTDQRGESRPQGNGPDVGAFETASSLPDPRSYTHADVTTRVENGTTLTTINGQLISYPQHVGQKTAVFVFANAAGTNDWLLLNPVSGWHLWSDCNSTAFPYAMHESMPWVTDIALFYDADLSAFQGWPILFGYGVGNDETSACTDMLNNTRYAHIATL